jgi:peptidoglycan/xylan/chitin deacetylase (PgdA/CDA1 family)
MAEARVLAYHSLVPWPGDRLGISPDAFKGQIRWLVARGWQCLSLDAWLDHIEAGTRPDRPSVVLTFDDGFSGLLEDAAPILLENGWTATVFVVTDALDCGSFPARAACGAHSPLARPPRRSITWGEAERWLRLGLSIGNHTRTHPLLTRIRGDLLHEEIAGAAAALHRRLGVERPAFCYPFGALDEIVAGVVRATGHRCGVVTPNVAGIPSGCWTLHRVGLSRRHRSPGSKLGRLFFAMRPRT